MGDKFQKFLPLSEQVYFILLSLAKEAKHGYAIAKDVRLLSEERVKLSVSTLYTLLKRLLEDGWIQRSGDDSAQKENSRSRKTYELTDLGRQILAVDVARLRKLVFAAELRQAESKA
jgi:DNA-binding PadR family transcriptional regulator